MTTISPRLEVLRRISDFLDEGDTPLARKLASDAGIQFQNESDVSRLISEELGKDASEPKIGSEIEGDPYAAKRLIPRSIHRYREQAENLRLQVPNWLRNPYSKLLLRESQATKEDLLEKLDKQFIQGGFSITNKGNRPREIGFGTTAWYFAIKDQDTPFVLEISIRKKYSASKGKIFRLARDECSLNSNFFIDIIAIDFNTGEYLFHGQPDTRFILEHKDKKKHCYSFSPHRIARALQETGKFNQTLFEINQEAVKRLFKASPFKERYASRADFTLHSIPYYETGEAVPSLVRFPGDKTFEEVIQKLDLRSDMERLISSGDVGSILNQGYYSTEKKTLSDGTEIFILTSSVSDNDTPFRGASRH